MHTEHPDTHHSGIDDECPECQKYVDQPTQLDEENLRRIWSGTIITKRDMAVFNTLYRAVVLTQRLGSAFAWREFRHGVDDIATFEPQPKPDQFALFDFGGRA